ncbi:exonuclease SbcCD subunit D [Brevibacterium otitidis]|uniref:Nuclease SbcCD subunit D n=1 Tax=Brevibacterium otitidis TaxID=53364 RepID=A0ABV5WYA5_9MICO|nr:exonuclease SbcCD subunit D [Brevibacterium otitidis]
MRILHTSDWHLGRTFFGVDQTRAQRAFLSHLREVVAAERVDVVLIAGDVYDRAIPPADALTSFDETVTGLLDDGVRVIATSGNHDSFMRLGHGRRTLDRAGLHLRTRLSDITWPVPLGGTAAAPEAVVYGIPYLEPGLVAERFGCARSHEAVLGHAMDLIRADHEQRFPDAKLIVAAHAFVRAQSLASESERSIDVGGVSIVSAEVFAGTDYTALGHLHRPQDVSPTVRYSGSPLPYSFTEAKTTKRMLLLDTSGAELTVESRELPAFSDVRTLRGTLEEVLQAAASARADGEDLSATLVSAELTDPSRVSGALGRLKEAFPGLIKLAWVNADPPAASAAAVSPRSAQRTDRQVFSDFYAFVTGGPAGADDMARFDSACQSQREAVS